MYHWYLLHPGYQADLEQAPQVRVEAQARAAYLAIVGFDAVAARLGRSVVAGVRRVARAYRGWRDRRLTIQTLSRLDDRMLRDVGIDRDSIERIANGLMERPAEPQAPKAAIPPSVAVPLLRLDLSCPELKHAA